MVMQSLFDSVCRCFGASPPQARPQQAASSVTHPEMKRRTSRLELQAKEWDALFDKKKPIKSPQMPRKDLTPDLDQAQAVAQAKLAANPSRHYSSPQSQKKRKSPASRRDDIFRTRNVEQQTRNSPPSGNSFSRFLSSHQVVANALCFATPVRDSSEEVQVADDASDTNTLNTCEDTITSTLYFDSKYSHVVESRPPMPLFSQFKVDTDESDQLRRIVATDSHNSLKMIRLLTEVNDPHDDPQMPFEDSSSDDEDELPQMAQKPLVTITMEDDEVPAPVKMSSSCSSKSTASTTPSSRSQSFQRERSRSHQLLTGEM